MEAVYTMSAPVCSDYFLDLLRMIMLSGSPYRDAQKP